MGRDIKMNLKSSVNKKKTEEIEKMKTQIARTKDKKKKLQKCQPQDGDCCCKLKTNKSINYKK